jgi:hypothetical protein
VLVVGGVVEGWGCAKLGTDLTQVIALSVVVDSTVEATDTLRAHAVAFTAGGDSVTAPIVWASLDTALLGVVDSTTGVFVGRAAGIARVQARTGSLRSNPIALRVTAAADTVAATTATADTVVVSTPDSLSDSLALVVEDTVTNPAPTAVPLANRPVAFAIASAPAGATVTLVTNDTTHAITAVDTVRTSAAGIAGVRVRYLGGGTLPDSVVVTASARRAVGTVVPGSPITFVVRLAP